MFDRTTQKRQLQKQNNKIKIKAAMQKNLECVCHQTMFGFVHTVYLCMYDSAPAGICFSGSNNLFKFTHRHNIVAGG